MTKANSHVPVVSTSKGAGHASNDRKWSKPSSFFKDRRRHQAGGATIPQTGLFEDIKTFRLSDIGTIRLFRAAEKAGYYDDDNMLLERLIQLLYKLPRHSRNGKLLTDAFITKLWSTLHHPQPSPIPTLVGHQHRHRTADGSMTNPYLESLGAAGTDYARAVAPMDVQSPDMPDAGLIFDTILGRNGSFKEHPCGISSMMFYLGVIITHDIFQTGGRNGGINLASSYLDLAPLYGNSLEEQNSMRQFKDGLLKPDCFAHKRILTFPPACCVFLLMFNRFHNYVVTQLANINEADRFRKPDSSPESDKQADKEAWKRYDEDLFQTGRLVTCGLYINIILKDYVRIILGINRTDSTWTIDPRSNMDRHSQKDSAPTGVGNQVSVEFNLLYRWHGIISKRDTEWTEREMRGILGQKDPKTATFHEMIQGFQMWENSLSDNPHDRTSVRGLERNSQGSYEDDDLVQILREAIEDTAGSFGAHSVPDCLRPVEMLGIMQARRWRVGTLNEFRSFIGLKRHKTFEDINPDPQVAAGLKALYGSPANVELYPGLVSEKTKPPMTPGSGVCVGYTGSRAILSDAVALVRGDRFYTDDFTPKNLTNWGFAEVDSDLDVDSGNVMYKLIFCAFPRHFQGDSIYAHHPLVTPAENRIINQRLGRLSRYSWEPPALEIVKSSNKRDGRLSDSTLRDEKVEPVAKSYAPEKRKKEIKVFIATTAQHLIKSFKYGVASNGAAHASKGIDVVSEVISLTFVRLAAEMFNLSLKASNDKRRGAYTDFQLSTILSVLFAANSTKLSPGRHYELQKQGEDLALRFKKDIPLSTLAKPLSFKGTKSLIRGYGLEMIKTQQHEEKQALADRAAELIACSAMVPTLLISESLDYHLAKGADHLEKVKDIAKQNTDESELLLYKLMLEGCFTDDCRASPQSKEATDMSGLHDHTLVASRFLSKCFPPDYHLADLSVFLEAMAALFKELVALPGLRRAPGAQGLLKSVASTACHVQTDSLFDKKIYMTNDCSSFWPVPTTMKIVWDSD